MGQWPVLLSVNYRLKTRTHTRALSLTNPRKCTQINTPSISPRSLPVFLPLPPTALWYYHGNSRLRDFSLHWLLNCYLYFSLFSVSLLFCPPCLVSHVHSFIVSVCYWPSNTEHKYAHSHSHTHAITHYTDCSSSISISQFHCFLLRLP